MDDRHEYRQHIIIISTLEFAGRRGPSHWSASYTIDPDLNQGGKCVQACVMQASEKIAFEKGLRLARMMVDVMVEAKTVKNELVPKKRRRVGKLDRIKVSLSNPDGYSSK
jgi:hypothetical protein